MSVQIFEHARGKIPVDVMIEHTDAFDWTVVTKVADIIDICAIGGRLPWDYEVLRKRTDITPELVLKTLDRDWDWDKDGLSSNLAITSELVLQTLDKDWDWGKDGLSSNPAITSELVLQTLDKSWDWYSLSRNPSITPLLILQTTDRDWDNNGLSRNPAITPELVLQTLNKGWSWGNLSCNPAITPELVLATKNKPWSEHTKIWAFRSISTMSLMKKVHTQWVHATYAPGSKRAVEIIKNLELMITR